MNIAVLFTGGTIGSTLAGDVIGTKTGAADGLLDTLPCVERDGHVEEITYQVYHPYTLLSENSTGLTIAQLAQSIREVVSEAKYTGSAREQRGSRRWNIRIYGTGWSDHYAWHRYAGIFSGCDGISVWRL